MLVSNYDELCEVKLPYAGRQHYMHPFDLASPTVPKGFDDYLPIVQALIQKARAREGTAYLTVDEKVVKAGMSQRRPGPHVDGCFNPQQSQWGHGGGGGGWNHYCNHIPAPRMSVIVAADVQGCKAWRGAFEGAPKNDGDLSHLKLPAGEMLKAGVGYLLTPDCIHESMIFAEDTRRTFIRIALPVKKEK